MASTEADKPSPPEYQIQVNRVDAIEAASCLSVALKQMLEKLSGPVVKLGLSLDDLVDKTPFETIQAGIIKLPTVPLLIVLHKQHYRYISRYTPGSLFQYGNLQWTLSLA